MGCSLREHAPVSEHCPAIGTGRGEYQLPGGWGTRGNSGARTFRYFWAGLAQGRNLLLTEGFPEQLNKAV